MWDTVIVNLFFIWNNYNNETPFLYFWICLNTTRKSFIGMSFIFITILIKKCLSWESTFSVKHSTNSVGVYKRLDFGFGNEIFYQLSRIFIMNEAFLCRCFLLLFYVVFIIFESSPPRKILQLNMDFFKCAISALIVFKVKLILSL